MSFQKVSELETQLSALQSGLQPPWERLDMTPEDYVKDLTTRWGSINVLMKSGSGDFSIVKSTVTDTLEFITWAQSKRELTSAVALIKSYMTRLKTHYDDNSDPERLN